MKHRQQALQKHLLEQEAEEKRIAEAFTRAELEIARLGIHDDYLVNRMLGKKIGGNPNHVNFRVQDNDAVWEMIENKVDTNEIVDKIYNTRGKMK